MSSVSFTDPPEKKIVRNLWNTPLLRHLHETRGIKYRYFGLPGTELNDIKTWKDMIEDVIAFEIRRPRGGERDWINSLRFNLKVLGVKHKAYFGPFEEVVLLGKDFDGQEFSQEKVVNLYNLDFCDEIRSPVETKDKDKKRLRFEAIREILQIQKKCFRVTKEYSHDYFVILLTVRNQTEAQWINDVLSDPKLKDTPEYIKKCQSEKSIPGYGDLIGTHGWCLKTFMYETLIQYFGNPNISALFFPMVKYNGNPVKTSNGMLPSPMLNWMILCKFAPEEVPQPQYLPDKFLSSIDSMNVAGSTLSIQIEPGETINRNQHLSPVKWFEPFEKSFFS